MFSIGALARVGGVTAKALRHYDRLVAPAGAGASSTGHRPLFGADPTLRVPEVLLAGDVADFLTEIRVPVR